jgi:hypothetical protein
MARCPDVDARIDTSEPLRFQSLKLVKALEQGDEMLGGKLER